MSAVDLASGNPIILPKADYLDRMTDHEFFELCRANPDWRIERTADGEVIVMAPTGGEAGRRNFNLTGIFQRWVEEDGSGVGFDSSTGFRLRNGATRAPDAAWIERSRWEALTAEEREEFSPICPDFVIELRSRTDRLRDVQAKMDEYMSCGARLGWLIDPIDRRVHVYRPGVPVEICDDPVSVSADPELPGFVLPLARIW